MEIRHEGAADAAAVARVVTEAFADDGRVAALWRDVVATGLRRAGLVAVESGEVVGHAGLSHCWLDARRELVDVLLLSPLSVLPARQQRGIGGALLAAALRAADEYAVPAVFLEGDPGYYGSRGFSPAAAHGCEAPSRRTPAPAFQVALLDGHRPWMSGRVIYPDVWWRHDAAGLRDPELSRIEEALGLPR